MRRWCIVSVVAVVVIVCAALVFLWNQQPHLPRGVMHIGAATINIEIADTDATRVQGLSGRSGLAPNSGMLFVFDHPDKYSFWMKDMHFPIDMVWLSADGTIVSAVQDVDPSTYPRSFTSSTTALFVLELPAHYMQAHGIKIGDAAILP